MTAVIIGRNKIYFSEENIEEFLLEIAARTLKNTYKKTLKYKQKKNRQRKFFETIAVITKNIVKKLKDNEKKSLLLYLQKSQPQKIGAQGIKLAKRSVENLRKRINGETKTALSEAFYKELPKTIISILETSENIEKDFENRIVPLIMKNAELKFCLHKRLEVLTYIGIQEFYKEDIF